MLNVVIVFTVVTAYHDCCSHASCCYNDAVLTSTGHCGIQSLS